MIKTEKKEVKKKGFGTKEYADSNVNCYFGCSNNCGYCYAKMMAIRFERKTEDNWREMVLNRKAVIKNYKKRKGRIMFPSSHDITTESLEYCVIVLRKLLKAGNEVLIVTKPNLWCIYELLNRLEKFKSQILFRFTITSISDQKLRFWEPNAPNYEERFFSLQLAKYRGFKTSISIEPYLDADPINIILALNPHCTGTIWLGKMNYIKANGILSSEKFFYDFQRKISSWYSIQKIISNLEKLPDEIRSKIRIKDSITRLYAKKGVVLKF